MWCCLSESRWCKGVGLSAPYGGRTAVAGDPGSEHADGSQIVRVHVARVGVEPDQVRGGPRTQFAAISAGEGLVGDAGGVGPQRLGERDALGGGPSVRGPLIVGLAR